MAAITTLSRKRFDILAGYSRQPSSFLFGTELKYLSTTDEKVLGILLRDNADGDFAGLCLGRDKVGRYRCVDVRPFSDSQAQAEADLVVGLSDWWTKPAQEFEQGDESSFPLDVFLPVAPADKLDPSFLAVSSDDAFSAAREVIEAMMPYFVDPDGTFVYQFQTQGFDARLWELYLFAALTELGCTFDRSYDAPDYLCDVGGYSFFIEATTVNPTMSKGVIVEPDLLAMNPEQAKAYSTEYMPIKWGSALYAKLQKKYWSLPHVAGKPLLFALQDFHVPHAMSLSAGTLAPYLYGLEFSAMYDAQGSLQVTTKHKEQHTWGNKVIPSGFFRQPGSEHISAVISNPLGTASKFNRLGVGAGFGSKDVQMYIVGTKHDHDPNASSPKPFESLIIHGKWDEPWSGGMNVFHNPNALHPLPDEIFKSVAQHRYIEGQIVSDIPDMHPYGVLCQTLVPEQ